MNIKEEINQYLFHPVVVETYQKYKSINKGEGYPELCYFGINFNKDGIYSFKFYFAFFRKLTLKEIQLFLPTTEDFEKYYHLWEESKEKTLEHSGCTFEVKFKHDLTPIFGFHYRLKPIKEAYDLIGYPTHLPFDVLSLGTRPGINFEYKNGQALEKKYYYLHTDEQRKYIADRFNIPFAIKAHLMEYTESDEFSKVNVWRFDLTKENLERPNAFNPRQQKYIDFLKETYNLINISDGYYEQSDIRASYYFDIDQSSIAPFDAPINFNIDTLKLFY